MPRYSPSKSYVIIACTPDLHERFYYLKRRANMHKSRKLSNRDFLAYLLSVFEEYLREQEKKNVVKSY
jgi:hypothetical protein